jgi:hypothetical protein
MDKCVDCKKIKELSSEVVDLKIDFWVSMVIIILISILFLMFSYSDVVSSVETFDSYYYSSRVEVYENCVLDKDKYYCVKGDKK